MKNVDDKNVSKKLKYKEIVNLFRLYRKEQIWLFIVCSVNILANIYLLKLVSDFINILAGGQKNGLNGVLLEVIFIAALCFLSDIYQCSRWHYFRAKIVNYMNAYMVEQMLSKPYYWFSKRTSGDITSSILNDGAMIAQNAGISILMGLLNILHIIVVIGIMFFLSPIIGVFSLAFSVFYFYINLKINGTMRDKSSKERGEYSKLLNFITEIVRGISEIKISKAVDFFTCKFQKQIEDKYYPTQKQIIRLNVFLQANNSMMSILFPLAVIALASYLTKNSALSVGMIFYAYSLTRQLIEPLCNLGDFYQGRERAMGAASRVYDFLYNGQTVINANNNLTTNIQGIKTIGLDIRTINYDNHTIEYNLDKLYKSGDVVVIKGGSGTGKSSIIKAILGIIDMEGKVQINGENLENVSIDSFYDYCTCVFQNTFFFNASLRENIRLGRNFTDDEIISALEMANIKSILNYGGLDYEITESGGNISGGEKRRIGLARAYLRKPQLLLLDEVTSGLDPINRDMIVFSLINYKEDTGCIIIVISHDDAFDQVATDIIEL